jgi:hypothetical protein
MSIRNKRPTERFLSLPNASVILALVLLGGAGISVLAQTTASPQSGSSELVTVASKGVSPTPQILQLSATTINFGGQTVNTSSAPRSVVVTNSSDSTVRSLTVVTSGEFTENHDGCDNILPGASCPISVTFTPNVPGTTSGALTVAADHAVVADSPRVVELQGNAVIGCNTAPFSLLSWRSWLPLLIAGAYFLGLVLVRWHMIAKPARAQLIVQINAVRSRLVAESSGVAESDHQDARIERINYLLDWALYPFKNRHFPVDKNAEGKEKSLVPGWLPWHTRFFNALFWPRGQELAGWSCTHEAELLLLELLPPERVRARMETAEQQLRLQDKPVSTACADRIHEALNSSAAPAALERGRALLTEALNIIYDKGDSDYFQFAVWHGKMIWLVGCALLFILSLAVTLQNGILLLFGAVGGLLSRLARTVQASEVSNDYGASWGSLFLSPLSGALSAWGGILLIVLGRQFNILGGALKVDWCDPYDPATLAIALLFGFSERLFDGLASQIQEKVVKGSTDAPSQPSGPAPTITSLDPPNAKLGRLLTIAAKGSNFVSGATASVTDRHGNSSPVKLEYTDASTVLLTATLTGEEPYTSTLTIANPDKQSAKFRFDVLAE